MKAFFEEFFLRNTEDFCERVVLFFCCYSLHRNSVADVYFFCKCCGELTVETCRRVSRYETGWTQSADIRPVDCVFLYRNASFKTSRFFCIAPRYVMPPLISFCVVDCMESSVKTLASFFLLV